MGLLKEFKIGYQIREERSSIEKNLKNIGNDELKKRFEDKYQELAFQQKQKDKSNNNKFSFQDSSDFLNKYKQLNQEILNETQSYDQKL